MLSGFLITFPAMIQKFRIHLLTFEIKLYQITLRNEIGEQVDLN